MYEIIGKEKWHDIIYSMWVKAPYVAEAAQPGQFVILMIDEKGEGSGNKVIAIIGARTEGLIIMEDSCRGDKNGI